MDSFLVAGGMTLVQFGGKRCTPCRNMRVMLLEYQMRNECVRIACVFWEDDPELFEKYNIGVIPVQVIFDEYGEEVFRHVGALDEDELHAMLSKDSTSYQNER